AAYCAARRDRASRQGSEGLSGKAVRPRQRAANVRQIQPALLLARVKLHDATGSPQLLHGLAEAVDAGWAIGGRFHQAFGVHLSPKFSEGRCDVECRAILSDYVEIPNPPLLGLLI